MSRFRITKIAASGEKVEYSSVSFEDGVNFIVGPSNTGKSYVISCIDFMFAGKEVPFSKDDEELDKLAELETRHKYYQLSLFESERKKSEQERMVDELFDKFTRQCALKSRICH